ncbi:anti-sigma factor [Streptomyces zingiberis]|uniref:Regulator of SigK n=1 Tax=Streptomyces zingiberis TaxID=2053010 RepID=A0ABX1BN24_9ACTN|nr:anti-sigma factor [Streptomyces zingiberis]NJP99135.1 anti-sigma factor [Streptomyces zingiberis]
MTSTAADLHTLTGAYALHALDAEERARFERHLTVCEACAEEVRELAATAARLGLAASAPPAPALKEQVIRRIATVRQEPPVVRAPARARVLRRLLSNWALAACVALTAALGATAAWQHTQVEDARRDAHQAQQRADQLAAVLAAPDAKSRTARFEDGTSGTVVVSAARDKAVFTATGMTPLPDGKVYQLWFADGDTMRPAGLMDAGRTSRAVLMEGALGTASAMGVTVEPAGGSPQPTSDPVVLLDLPA